MNEMSLRDFAFYSFCFIAIAVGLLIATVTVKKAIALVEYATTACRPYAIHQYFIKNDFLYVVCRDNADDLVVKTLKNPFP